MVSDLVDHTDSICNEQEQGGQEQTPTQPRDDIDTLEACVVDQMAQIDAIQEFYDTDDDQERNWNKALREIPWEFGAAYCADNDLPDEEAVDTADSKDEQPIVFLDVIFVEPSQKH